MTSQSTISQALISRSRTVFASVFAILLLPGGREIKRQRPLAATVRAAATACSVARPATRRGVATPPVDTKGSILLLSDLGSALHSTVWHGVRRMSLFFCRHRIFRSRSTNTNLEQQQRIIIMRRMHAGCRDAVRAFRRPPEMRT